MASIPEIQDPSTLQYAARSAPAYDAPAYDRGFGPPSGHMGWVRTGSFPLVGVPDYLDFTMLSFDQQSGTTVSFNTPIWDNSYMDPFPSDLTTGVANGPTTVFSRRVCLVRRGPRMRSAICTGTVASTNCSIYRFELVTWWNLEEIFKALKRTQTHRSRPRW